MEQQRNALVTLIHATRPFLLELEHPLAGTAEILAAQVAAFQLMTKDYSKLTAALKRFAGSLPTNQTTNASVIGRLMNNVRMGYYPTDPDHVTLITRGIAFPSGITTNLLDPCCGTGVALRRMATGNNCFCYGVELDRSRAEQAQAQLHRVGFGSFFGAHISFGAFHVVFLNPPYLSVLSENGGRSRDEKRFLLESLPLLTRGGLMVYIVPYYRLTEDICRVFCDNFEDVSIHRFMDGEFKKFKQVAVMGLRRQRTDNETEAERLCKAASHPEQLLSCGKFSIGRVIAPLVSQPHHDHIAGTRAPVLRVKPVRFRQLSIGRDRLRRLQRRPAIGLQCVVRLRDCALRFFGLLFGCAFLFGRRFRGLSLI